MNSEEKNCIVNVKKEKSDNKFFERKNLARKCDLKALSLSNHDNEC